MVHVVVVVVLVFGPRYCLQRLDDGLCAGMHLEQFSQSPGYGVKHMLNTAQKRTDRKPRKMRLSGRTGPMEGELGVMKGESSSPVAPDARGCLRGERGGEDGGEANTWERETACSPRAAICL